MRFQPRPITPRGPRNTKESDMKNSGKVVVLLALLAAFCSGGSCRSDVAQSAATSFFDTFAEAVANALATRLPANNP